MNFRCYIPMKLISRTKNCIDDTTLMYRFMDSNKIVAIRVASKNLSSLGLAWYSDLVRYVEVKNRMKRASNLYIKDNK